MKGIDWLSPRPLFLLIVILGVFAPSFAFLNHEDWFSVVWPFLFFDRAGTMAKAMGIYMAVATLFVVAHARVMNGVYAGPARPLNHDVFPRRIAIMIGVGLATIILIVYLIGGVQGLLDGAADRTRAFAGIQGLFLLVNILASAAIGWMLRLTSRPTDLSEKLFFAGYMVVALGILGLQGQKSTLFILIGALGIIWHVRVRRFSLAEMLSAIFILYCALMAYHIYKQEYLVLGRVVSFSSGAQFYDTFFLFLNQQFFGNFMQLQTMSVLIEGMPIPLAYQYGQTYWAGLLLLIPRSFFPEKPLPSTGTFTEAFWPDAWRATGTTLPAGVFGEGYMNFGVAGVVMLAWLIGSLYGQSERRIRANKHDDYGLAIYAVFLASMLHYFRGELASVSYTALSILLPILYLTMRERTAPIATSQS